MRELRVEKMLHVFHKVIYFTTVTIWGYIVLKDKDYMPPFLGGSGDYSISISKKYFPYSVYGPDLALQRYILITSGFHFADFANHWFLQSKQNDFIEMGLHHIVAVYLFGGLYFFNLWEGGATLAFLHDIADIFVCSSKLLGETNYTNTTGAVFVFMMFVWIWTRLISLPYAMWILFMQDVKFGYVVKEIFLYLLSCMFCLHAYWFTLFFKILGKFLKSGVAEDTINKTEKSTNQKGE